MTSPSTYRAYGLTLQSKFLLPCPRAAARVAPDVHIGAGSAARFARARDHHGDRRNAQSAFECRRLADGATYLRWAGLFEFLISSDGRRILYRRQGQASPESFNVHLLSHVLSFSLLALGIESLHGTAVEVNGGAVVFLGDCGYGKSTLGAAFLARGFRIVTDDLVVLKNLETGWMIHPGVPRLKLFSPVARGLLGPDLGGTPMIRNTAKLVLTLRAGQAVHTRQPLKALYVLSDPAACSVDKPAGVRVEPCSRREAFLEVIRAAFNLLILERDRVANQFAFATSLTADVPVRRLVYPRDLSLLPAVCDVVLADLAA